MSFWAINFLNRINCCN